ncbi:hypothetical protein V8C34DRAFT_123376 [Trichoderma compactum]
MIFQNIIKLLGILNEILTISNLTLCHPELVQVITVHGRKFFSEIIALGIFIVMVELTLVWNHIQGIYTCLTFGQLFPLITGVGNFILFSYQLLTSLVLGDLRLKWII